MSMKTRCNLDRYGGTYICGQICSKELYRSILIGTGVTFIVRIHILNSSRHYETEMPPVSSEILSQIRLPHTHRLRNLGELNYL
jgi:hypothetical protein